MKFIRNSRQIIFAVALVLTIAAGGGFCQGTASAKADLGSQTAKNGFRNENEIRDKFINWKTDDDARVWLTSMNYKLSEIISVSAMKPNGEKSDVQLTIKTKRREFSEGISIKLVSSEQGFNQIDKRWLSHYVKMWKIPADVNAALQLFVGEVPPNKPSREKKLQISLLRIEKRSFPICSAAMARTMRTG